MQINGYRVIVNVEVVNSKNPYYRRTPEEAKREADDIVKNIKRHVDLEPYVQPYVEADSEAVCEHCGYHWGEDSASYNGGCCDKDEECNPETSVQAA